MKQELRTPITRMSNLHRRLRNEYLKAGRFDAFGNGNLPDLGCPWVDRAPVYNRQMHDLGGNFLSACWTESKRRIRREIQSNPHLQTKHKAELLRRLISASIRHVGRGSRDADSAFAQRIQALDTAAEAGLDTTVAANAIRDDIAAHPCLPKRVKENLLYNLGNYEARLSA